MPRSTAPADVVRAVTTGVSRLLSGDLTEQQEQDELDALAGHYADRTDVRHPLAPLGDTPLRTRAELRRHFAGGPGSRTRADTFEAVGEVHQTTDPEVVVYEFSYVGSVGGREFSVPCLFVTRVRDGVIVESRDYLDHLGLARAFDRLGTLTTALAATAQS